MKNQAFRMALLFDFYGDVLTDRQKGYAATDAWACVRMYNYLEERKRKQDYRVVEVADN